MIHSFSSGFPPPYRLLTRGVPQQDDMISKPFRLFQLVPKIEELVARS